MDTEFLTERTDIEPETLIGTKWVGWGEMFCDRLKVEFVDKTNCIYTSESKKYTLTYTVTKGKIFLSYVEKPFELRGNILFNGIFPAFQKAA